MTFPYLFVYGTLKRGSRNRYARLLASQAQLVCAARMAGRLYSFGRHPGAVLSYEPGEWVRGEVFLLKRPETTLPALDAYEGHRYQRIRVPVEFASARRVDSWVYLLRIEPAGGRIVSGEWARR